jgi:hypothetical protein
MRSIDNYVQKYEKFIHIHNKYWENLRLIFKYKDIYQRIDYW